MEPRSRYQILKDFFFYYGCAMSIMYALQIASDVIGKKLPYSDQYQNPYGFFAVLLLVLLIQPYLESYSKRKTISDYFPNADKL
jgi:hypothetical protein